MALLCSRAAAKAEIRTRPLPQWRVAGLGLSQPVTGFDPLPGVEEELDGIVRDEVNEQDIEGVLPGRMYLNNQFTTTQLQEVLDNPAAPYSVIHLASHFRFRPGSEVDSFLLLGEGQRLSLAELKEGDYPLTDVDLLTLSACETGLGGENQDGSEVEGFGVLAQNQGAKAVLATLWKVADKSTGQFMQTLYKLRQDNNLTKAEALRQAQERFIRGESFDQALKKDDSSRAPGSQVSGKDKDFKREPKASYAHPYYWAPFILMGNFL